MLTRSKIIAALCSSFLVFGVFLSFISYKEDRYIRQTDQVLGNLASWSGPKKSPALLNGRLSPSVYTLFQQVYDEADPPDIVLPEVRRVCEHSVSKPNLYLSCTIATGGMTTLRTQIKSCLNMAIWQGLNVVLPTTPHRNAKVLDKWDDAHLTLDVWLDRDFLVNRMQESCPNIKFVSLDDSYESKLIPSRTTKFQMCQRHPEARFCTIYGPYAADDYERPWKMIYEKDLEELQASSQPSENVVVDMFLPNMMFNKTIDHHTERRFFEMDHMLRAIDPVRQIVRQIVDFLTNDENTLSVFTGVHFRVESDAVNEMANGWVTTEEQLERIFVYAEEARVRSGDPVETKTIYLACGEQDKVELFRERAHTTGWTVIDKWSLAAQIRPGLADEINALDFDHMAIIDFSILLVSDFFIGTGNSAFSYNIAHARNPRGRFHGNALETNDQLSIEENLDVAAARTHLFEAKPASWGYQCCL